MESGDAVRGVVDSAAPDTRFTVVDLCSGKGFLSMVLSEMLPTASVERIVLIDKAWPPFDWKGPIAEHHISDEHIFGLRRGRQQESTEGMSDAAESTLGTERGTATEAETWHYFDTWPIPLYPSKQNLKNPSTLRGLRRRLFDRCEGPVLLLAVHLCGTLSLRAVDLFNDIERIQFLALKPCCLPGMVRAYAALILCARCPSHSQGLCLDGLAGACQAP